MSLSWILIMCLVPATLGFEDNIPGIMDNLWNTYLEKGADGSVNQTSWIEFFKRYQVIPPIIFEIEIGESEFVPGWMEDMGVTLGEAMGYYRIFELDSPTAGALTDRDCEKLIAYCDDSWDQSNDENEFWRHMPGLFRPIPWAVMFVRYDANGNEVLSRNEFFALLSDWDANGDGGSTVEEFLSFWQDGGYGDETTGRKSHFTLDFDGDGAITEADIETLFLHLDQDNNNSLIFDEFLQIDFVINGWPSKQNGVKQSPQGRLARSGHSQMNSDLF